MTGEAPAAPSNPAQADRLYRGFPDFSAWGALTPAGLDLWSRYAASLEERRKAATPESLKSAVEVAIRAAALDTGAIEGLYSADRGFTMTVAVQGLAWEQMIEERGAGVRNLFEAHLEAYQLVLDTVTRSRPLTEVWIRQLHQVLCAPQKTYRVLTEVGWQDQELPQGQYKTRPNHVRLADGTVHAYAPVDQVPSEMHRLLEQIRTPEFEAAHPVLQAAYIHYAFVMIHPFADGNGRVARALASIYFYRTQSIPLLIFANQRPPYLEALARADHGDHRPVISFFLDRGIDTMQLVAESLMTAAGPDPKSFGPSLEARSQELSAKSVGSIALRLLYEIRDQWEVQLKGLPALSWGIGGGAFKGPLPDGYRLATPDRAERFYLQKGLSVLAELRIAILLATRPENPFPFLVLAEGSTDLLEIRFEDVDPELTALLKIRLANWVQRQLGRALAATAT